MSSRRGRDRFDGRKIVHRQDNAGPDGTERLLMELVLTRKAEAPAAEQR